MSRANCSQTGCSGAIVPLSGMAVPPLRTASVRCSNASIMSGELRKFTALPTKAGERRLRKTAESGESA